MVTGRAISVWSEVIAELVRPMADAIAELWPEDGRPSDGSRKMVKWWQQLLISKGWTFLAKTFSTHHPHIKCGYKERFFKRKLTL